MIEFKLNFPPSTTDSLTRHLEFTIGDYPVETAVPVDIADSSVYVGSEGDIVKGFLTDTEHDIVLEFSYILGPNIPDYVEGTVGIEVINALTVPEE